LTDIKKSVNIFVMSDYRHQGVLGNGERVVKKVVALNSQGYGGKMIYYSHMSGRAWLYLLTTGTLKPM